MSIMNLNFSHRNEVFELLNERSANLPPYETK